MPSPIWNGCVSLPYTPSSCCQITRSIGVAPRPPYSFGQCRQAQPASAFFFCQALPTSTMSSFCRRMRPSEDLESSASSCLGALASIHLRAVARNSASCGVSSKFMVASFSLSFRGALKTRTRNLDQQLLDSPMCNCTSEVCALGRIRNDDLLSPSPGWYLVERDVLVDPYIAGQAEHPLGDDVAHDLVGAAFDPGTGRTQQHRLEFAERFGVLWPAQHAGRALQIQRIGRHVLDHRACDQFADRILRSRALALRQRRDRAHAGVFQ